MTGVLVITVLLAPFAVGAPVPQEAPAKPTPQEVEIRCYDDSLLRVTLLDETLMLDTKYGEMKIAVSDVKHIDFASRTPPAVKRQIDDAIKNLGNPDFQTRERASQALKDFNERAYPVVAAATKTTDPEVSRRAEEVCSHLKNRYGANHLVVRTHDLITTEDSKLAGTLKVESLKVMTNQFGEQSLKLSDIKSLRPKGATDAIDLTNVQEAPTNLNSATYQNQFGKEFVFKLTGSVPGVGGTAGVWGTDQYTLDSNLAVAAVHAGVLQNGQVGMVRVRVVVSPPQFAATPRNGVTTATYTNFPMGAYEFVK